MARNLLYAIGAMHVFAALIMWFAPHYWYLNTPGVADMGGYNQHFVRDIALAFLVSGLAMWHGARVRQNPVALYGAAWPVLHAVLHVGVWVQRGTPADTVALINLTLLQAPAWAGLWAACSIRDLKGSTT